MKKKQEEQDKWESIHIPFRDAVFEEHETSSARAESCSSRAKQVWQECEKTQTLYKGMKDKFMEEIDAMNKEMTDKYEEEAG